MIYFVLFILIMFAVSQIFGLHNIFNALRNYVDHSGFFGICIFILIFAFCVLFAVPVVLLIILTGSLFGLLHGIIISSIASTLGSGLAFIASRHFVRGFIFDVIGHNETFQKLNNLISHRGDIIVAIVRLVPFFPSNVMNYGFGLTHISFRTYLFWSWLCMLPEISILICGTHTILRIILEKKIPWLELNIFLIVTIILFLIVKQLRKSVSF